jgi:SAM-dependent methyltransferase
MEHLESFWDNKHNIKDKNLLSGCLLDETIDFLQVKDKLLSEAKILEVGVGLGFVTEALSKIGKVSAVDISDVALETVKPFCEFVFRSDNTSELPKDYYDLIICHNVVQHIPTNELKRELIDVISSLNSDGLFALEFVSNGAADTGGENYSTNAASKGWLFRNVDFMTTLVNECGGLATCVYNGPSIKKKSNLSVHILHIRKF